MKIISLKFDPNAFSKYSLFSNFKLLSSLFPTCSEQWNGTELTILSHRVNV